MKALYRKRSVFSKVYMHIKKDAVKICVLFDVENQSIIGKFSWSFVCVLRLSFFEESRLKTEFIEK